MIAGDIVARFSADMAEFYANVDMGAQKVDKFKDNVEKNTSKVSGSFNEMSGSITRAMGALGVSLSVAGLIQYTRSVINTVSHINDLAAQTGIAASTLSGFKSTLEENGTSLDAFARGMFMAQRQIGEIKTSTDPALKAIKELGLNFDDLRSSNTEDFIQKISTAVAGVEDPMKRANLGTVLLSRSFKELQPALEAIGKNFDQLKRSGLSNADIAAIDDAGDALTRFGNKILVWSSGALLSAIQAYKEFNALIQLNMGLLKSQGGGGAVAGGMAGSPIAGALLPKADSKNKPSPAQFDDTSKAIDGLTKSFENQIRSLQAEEIAFTQGEAAAQKFLLTQQAISEVGASNLPKFQQQIDTIVKLSASERDRKTAIDNLIESMRTQKAEQDKLKAAGLAYVDVQKKIADALTRKALDPYQQQLFDINKEFDDMIAAGRKVADEAGKVFTPDEINRARAFALAIAAIKEQERVWGELAAEIKPPIQASLTDMEQSFSQTFDTIGSGITRTFDGIMMGTQTWGEGMKNLMRNVALSILEEFIKLAALNPLKNFLFSDQIASGAMKALPTIMSLFTAADGGIVPGARGSAVPIIAHAGETITPIGGKSAGSAPNVSVKILGSIIPSAGVTPDQVVQIGYQNLSDRGGWMSAIERRISR